MQPDTHCRPRILLVAPQPFYEDRGTPIALLHVLKSYVAHGHEVDVLTYPLGASPDLPHVRYLRVANPLRFRSIPIGFSLRKVFLDALICLRLRRLLAKNRYAFIHAVEETAFPACALRHLAHVPVVYDMQSNLCEQLCEHRHLGWRPLQGIWRRCQQWLISRSSAVACSLGLADCVREVAPGKPVHEWHYPGQSAQPAPDEADALRQSLEIEPGQQVVVYTGNFESYQGIDLLLEAMPRVAAQSPNAVFVLVGATPDEIEEVTHALSRRLPASRYRLAPRVRQDRVPAYIQLADVLLSPRSYGGNLPLKVIEYLGSARPIVATDIKAHRRVLNEELALLVEPTGSALAEGVLRLLGDPALRRSLAERGLRHYQEHLSWEQFHRSTGLLLAEVNEGVFASQAPGREDAGPAERVSVVVPVRNGEASLPRLLEAIHAQERAEHNLEVVVVDDGSTDDTAAVARELGARVVSPSEMSGNPAHARNIGALQAHGDFLIFLDVDCVPEPGWLDAMLATHARGWRCIGGALSMPDGLDVLSRVDYYCGWYHTHERQAVHTATQHPPCNLGIERSLFLSTCRFTEQQPIAYAHEELAWQAELKETGIPILFQPAAKAGHHNREGLGNLWRRNYRWAYSAVESKQGRGITRASWMYQYPLLAALTAIPLIPVYAIYIIACWVRAGRLETLWLSPLVLLGRIAYGVGMLVGTLRWIFVQGTETERRPLWE